MLLMLGCGNVSLICSSAELAFTQEYEWVSASLQQHFLLKTQTLQLFWTFLWWFEKCPNIRTKRRLKAGVCPGPVAKHLRLYQAASSEEETVSTLLWRPGGIQDLDGGKRGTTRSRDK